MLVTRKYVFRYPQTTYGKGSKEASDCEGPGLAFTLNKGIPLNLFFRNVFFRKLYIPKVAFLLNSTCSSMEHDHAYFEFI